MLTDVHRLALFPQSLMCTHNLLGSMCVKNARPSWWLIYFIARDRQGFPPPPLFIKLGHLVTFASWFKPKQSQENSFPTRRTGIRRKGKRKEQKKKQEKWFCGINGAKNCFYWVLRGSHFLQTQIREWGSAAASVCSCTVSWVNESEGGKKINEIIDVTCQI